MLHLQAKATHWINITPFTYQVNGPHHTSLQIPKLLPVSQTLFFSNHNVCLQNIGCL